MKTAASGPCQGALIHLSKPSRTKWTKINKDREDLNNVINDVDFIELLNSIP